MCSPTRSRAGCTRSGRGSCPGGNTRTTIHQPPFPLTIIRGEGARITDADGHEYTDLLGEYTAGLYGHSHPVIVDAIRAALADGIVLEAPNRYETALAEAVCARFPSVDLVRFCNSGTEANLLALSLSRAVTGRAGIAHLRRRGRLAGILLFAHGISPLNPPFRWIVGEYNDVEGAARLVAERAGELAAVIVEPLPGAAGVIPGDPSFLHALREATTANGVLLIFDEVMTARLSTGGMQQLLDIGADLTTLAKFVGGGLSFGAFGAAQTSWAASTRAARRAAARGDVQQRRPDDGRRSRRYLTQVLTEAEIARLNGLGDRLRNRLNAFAVEPGHRVLRDRIRLARRAAFHTYGPVRSEGDVPDA